MHDRAEWWHASCLARPPSMRYIRSVRESVCLAPITNCMDMGNGSRPACHVDGFSSECGTTRRYGIGTRARVGERDMINWGR